VKYKKRTLSIHSVLQLDKYLMKNLKTIDQTEICIATRTTNPKTFNEVLVVLKKYNITHFSLYRGL
jgi:hypothetical protein